MPGNTHFNVAVTVKNADLLPELAERLLNMAPAFEAIIPEWAGMNDEKFDEARGLESVGAQVDDQVFWEPLKPSSSKRKRRIGRMDWILVDTGDLRRALGNPDLMFQRIGAQDAAFGTPLNLEEADKVRFQWAKRQPIFLSTLDQNAIRRIVQDYFSMGGNFQEKRFSKGLAAVRLRAEIASMDAEFESAVSAKDFD